MYRGKLREDKVQVIPSLKSDGIGAAAWSILRSPPTFSDTFSLYKLYDETVFVTLMRSSRAVFSHGE